MSTNGFTGEQTNYLQGFVMGSEVARLVRGLPVLSGGGQATPVAATVTVGGRASTDPPGPDAALWRAQDAVLAAGKTLCKEEQAKRESPPLDLWETMVGHARDGRFPRGTDVLLWKYHGLFYVAPAQDSFMCRLRFAGGALPSYQLRGVADLAGRFGGGSVDCTTRANLQIREIAAADGVDLLTGLADLGVIVKGSGADNIRNITASPLSGLDPRELIETLPPARELNHAILNDRTMYGLPRKFNISFDGAGTIGVLEDTNDVGFAAVSVPDGLATPEVPAGVYFELLLGGITGHRDFARPTGVLVAPQETTAVARAIVRVFLAHGDRTDRKTARLKYVLDAWGFEKFLEHVEADLGRPLTRFPVETLPPRPPAVRNAHLGVHPQRRPGLCYVGVLAPVGRITCDQARAIADLADRYGDRSLRLTVWQNLLIPNVADEDVDAVVEAIQGIGLDVEATNLRAGLVACTGNAGCKFANSNTKDQALRLVDYLEERLTLDVPVNIHLTGCPNSCAQHYIGDIGLLGTKVEAGDDLVEGYHVHLGGGYGDARGIALEVARAVAFDDVPPLVERLLTAYLDSREPEEAFAPWARRTPVETLRGLARPAAASA